MRYPPPHRVRFSLLLLLFLLVVAIAMIAAAAGPKRNEDDHPSQNHGWDVGEGDDTKGPTGRSHTIMACFADLA